MAIAPQALLDSSSQGRRDSVNRQERRRSPRVPVRGHQQLPRALRDVSLGGFSLETTTVLPRNSVQDFRLRYPDGSSLVLRARVVHSRREARPRGGHVCITGVAFLGEVAARETPRRLAS
jgi:hypothetical protein